MFPCILPQQQKLSWKGVITWQKFVDYYQYRTRPVFYNDILFCKVQMKSMHPCKSYWAETNINTTTKTKSIIIQLSVHVTSTFSLDWKKTCEELDLGT